MIFEVGPRDGLQNEKTLVSTDDKVWLCRELVAAGISKLEAGALVRADRVPQMADSDAVANQLLASADTSAEFYFLVPNLKGLERALAQGIRHIAVFTAATDTFNQKNIGMTVQESLSVLEEVVKAATQNGIQVRGYVSTVWGCPFEGRVKPTKALSVIEKLLSWPLNQVSIGDTIGVATPKGVREVLQLIPQSVRASRLAVHFHDTRGTALANAASALELGIGTLDSSIGGLGGCPFAPGASGNLATEDLLYFLKENGVHTGINYSRVCETSLQLSKKMMNRPLSSKALQAYLANCSKNPVWDA